MVWWIAPIHGYQSVALPPQLGTQAPVLDSMRPPKASELSSEARRPCQWSAPPLSPSPPSPPKGRRCSLAISPSPPIWTSPAGLSPPAALRSGWVAPSRRRRGLPGGCRGGCRRAGRRTWPRARCRSRGGRWWGATRWPTGSRPREGCCVNINNLLLLKFDVECRVSLGYHRPTQQLEMFGLLSFNWASAQLLKARNLFPW